ncbi:serine peptidase, partial [Rhizobium johnstonii]
LTGAPDRKLDLAARLHRADKAQPLTVELGTLPIDQKDASADDNSKPQQPEAPASEKALADLGLTVGPSDDGKGLAI